MKILFIEDEESARVGLKHILELKQNEVDVARDADEAVALLKDNDYQLIIVDIMLPAGDVFSGIPFREVGKELLSGIRSGKLGLLSTPKEVPAVVITAMADMTVNIELSSMKNVKILHKPIDPDDIVSEIEQFLIGFRE